MTQGARANKSGQVLEMIVEQTLQCQGYLKIPSNVPKQQQREYLLHSTILPKCYARNVYIGTGIYENSLNADFFVIGASLMSSRLIIECKWQQSKGSVDEKFPYLNLNIKDCYPDPTVVIIAGFGTRQGAIDWFKKQVGDNQNLLAVHNLESFVAWANNNL